jgi:hypothetical protein
MNLFKHALLWCTAALLAACGGGGGNSGTPILGPGPTPTAADLVIVLSASSVANSGSDTITATITALDANRNAVQGVPVTVSVNANGVVTPAATATDSAGRLTAQVGIGSDTSLRTITITATAGSLVRTAPLSVTPAGGTVTASDLVLTLSASSIANTGNETITATVTALDANRNALAGAPVTVSVDANAIATTSGGVTAANGRVTSAITIGADRNNRTITVTARSGSLTRTLPLVVTNSAASVVASDLVIVLSSTNISSSGLETVVATATALDANRNTIAGIPVTFTVDANATATAGAPNTDASGQARATVGIGSDRTVRTINVTARSGSLTRSASLSVISGVAPPVASDLVLVLSASSIANNGTQTVRATVTALDARRNTLASVPVTISVDSGATATVTGSSTDAGGTVAATVGIGADRSNRIITVTATSGSLVRTAALQVTDSTGGTPSAADLSLVLSAPSLPNGGTSVLVATATAVDANRNAVPGIPVTIRVDSSALATVSGPVTNASGVVTAQVGVGADRSNRVVTVTATSGTLTRTASFRVVGADITATFAPLVTAGTTNNQIEYKLVDVNALPMVGQSVSVSAPGLPTATGLTDLNGRFLYTYAAPAVAGSLTLTATGAGDSEQITITVQSAGGGSIAPAASLPRAASLALDPSVVSINSAGSNANQTELRALFLGADNTPIPRVRARFDLDGNATNTDGRVSWLGGTYAYSDSNGVARGTFTAGQRASPTAGVTVRVCYDVGDFDPATCPNATRATLTVANEALSVNIRTNELIKSGAASLTYIKEYVVMVVDAAGQAKADVLITPSVDLLAYYKGFYTYDRTLREWVVTYTLGSSEAYRWNAATQAWVNVGPTVQPQCPNEDVNRNGVREAGTVVAGVAAPALSGRGEDLNWNGELDPRKADVAIKVVGSPKTDANGLAIVQIEYGRSLATWVDFMITVTAAGISGSESRARYIGSLYGLGALPAPRESITDEAAPAFVIGPYGRGAVCTDDR